MVPLITVILATATACITLAIATHRGDILKGAPPWVEVGLFALSGALYLLAGVLAIVHYRKDKKKEHATLPVLAPAQSQHVQANPHIYIGHDVLRQPPPAAALIQPRVEEKSHPPNILVGDPRVAKLRFIHHTSSDLISWTEDSEGKQNGILLCFRNESIWQKKVLNAQDAKAQLQYFINDEEVGAGFRSGWLDSPYDLTDLKPGGEAKCAVLLIQADDGKFSIASKVRTHASGYDKINDRFTDINELPDTVLVRLLDQHDQLLMPEVCLELTGDGNVMAYKISER